MNKIAKMRVGLALPVALVMASTCWGVDVPYVDANGNEGTYKNCTKLTASNANSLGSGCYVVDQSLNLTNQLRSSGAITLILADGVTLKVTKSGDDAVSIGADASLDWLGYMKDLTIYGQTNQTGKLILNATGSGNNQTGRGIHAANVNIYGGLVTVTSEKSDAICATQNVSINRASVSATTESSYDGIKAGCIITSSGTITLDWTNLTNYVKASSYSGTVKVASGKTFKDEAGNKYEEGSLSSTQKNTLANQYLMPYAPVVFVDGKAIIDGGYTGSVAVDFPEGKTVDVSSIDYQREFTDDVAATVVLPFSLPEGASVNAKFYGLRTIVQEGCQWKAKMKNIGTGNLPAANTPYIVKVQGTTLTFGLNGGKAHLQTQATENHEVTITGTETDNWLFMGNYSYRTWADDGNVGLYYALFGEGDMQGWFGKVSTTSTAPAMRSYFRKKDENVKIVCSTPSGRPAALGESAIVSEIPEVIEVELIDEDDEGEHTTFVGRMNTRTGEIQMKRDYDLKGRKLNGAPTARGAYYGKKVIKK